MSATLLVAEKPPDQSLIDDDHSSSTSCSAENDATLSKDADHDTIPKETLKPVNNPTLGQTLKEELKKSSKKLQSTQQHQKAKTPLAAKIVTYPLPSLNSSEEPEKQKEIKRPTDNKRKRPRRNPVWQYFDVEDGIAKCLCYTLAGKKCEYSTKSVFSTNLKVHLKSHHKQEFAIVLQAEEVMATAQALQQQAKQHYERPMDLTKVRTERFNTHLSAVDQQRLLELQKRFLENNNVSSADALHNSSESKTLVGLLNNNNTPKGDSFLDSLDFDNLTPAQKSLLKRKRLRRHPVWHFFNDINEKTVGCNMCDFETNSVYSTNLKMHLKCHHKEQFQQVLKMEGDQPFSDDSFSDANGVNAQTFIKKARTVAEKDRNKMGSNGNEQALTLDQNLLMLSASEQLAAVVGLLCSNDSTDNSNILETFLNGAMNAMETSQESTVLDGIIDSPKIEASSSSASEMVDETNTENMTDIINQINAIPESPTNKPLLLGLKKQLRDIALIRLMQSVGDVQIFSLPAFRDFVAALCPEYTLPSETELLNMKNMHFPL